MKVEGRYSRPRGRLLDRRAGRPYRAQCGGSAGGGRAARWRCAQRGGGAHEFLRAQGARRALRVAGGHRSDRRKLQRQSRLDGSGVRAAGARAEGRRIAVLGDMLEMGADGPPIMPRSPRPSPTRAPIWFSPAGPRWPLVGRAAGIATRGLCANFGGARAAVSRGAQAGRHGAGQGFVSAAGWR